jgi:DNA-binding response OmpR family regulator
VREDRKKILCIEDDREIAALIGEDLAERGFEVLLAHDEHAGLAAILGAIRTWFCAKSACR